MRKRLKTWFCICCLLIGLTSGKARPTVSIARYEGGREAAVSYTFDDGLEEHYTKVFPVLKRLGLRATFCIIGSKVGGNQKGTPCMTWEQLKEMAAAGQEISNHGWAHKAVIHLTGEALRHEVQANDTAIFRHSGLFPRTYFYPGNRKTEEALTFCAHDRVGTRTEQVSIGSKRDTTWLKHWVNDLIVKGQWGVGMTHGITTGYDCFPNPQVLWDHLAYVSRLQTRLWIAPFCDVAAYVRERNATSLKTEWQKGCLKVIPKLLLNKQIFHFPLTLQITSATVTKAEQDGKRLTLHKRNNLTFLNFNPHGGCIRIYWKR